MDMVLTRKQFRSDGIFSQLTDQLGAYICETLEHAYPDKDGKLLPKIPTGYFQCIRGTHQLAGASASFETFEITGVPNHTGILFHCGNFQGDSSGCILVGALFANDSGIQMLTQSRATFARLMDLQKDCDSFYLLVE